MQPYNSLTNEYLVEECVAQAKYLESLQDVCSYVLEEVLDIRYILDFQKQYLGSELLINSDGPNIKINTFDNTVQGIFGTNVFTTHYKNDQIDSALQIKFNEKAKHGIY